MTQKVSQKALTPAAGKRLIAKGIAARADIRARLTSGTVVVIAGTTNGYVAEEILRVIGESEGVVRNRFFRGLTLPPGQPTTEAGRLPDESEFPGDVVIVDGKWRRGKTIFDVVGDLRSGDIVIKGANAVDLVSKRAAIYIGHPQAGTIGVALQAVVGRRVRLILAAGVEKRVTASLDDLANLVNDPAAGGPRLLPVPGELYTEIEAISALTGASAVVSAGGGVAGAEGSCWFAVSGTEAQVADAKELLASVAREPSFVL